MLDFLSLYATLTLRWSKVLEGSDINLVTVLSLHQRTITGIMDTKSKKDAYNSAAYNAAGEALMSFKPINAIHQHICAFHPYACAHPLEIFLLCSS